MKLYAYKTKDGRYLAEMSECHEHRIPVFGAVNPLTDGNYYRELCISAIRNSVNRNGHTLMLGATGWIKWLREEAIPNGYAAISEEYDFDPKEVKVVTFSEVK